MRSFGFTIRREGLIADPIEHRAGFRTLEARDLAAKEALRLLNHERRPGTNRYTVAKWSYRGGSVGGNTDEGGRVESAQLSCGPIAAESATHSTGAE